MMSGRDALPAGLGCESLTSGALHNLIAASLNELEQRGETIEIMRAPNGTTSIDTKWGSIEHRDEHWEVSYWEEVSACEAHGLDPEKELRLTPS